MRTLLIFPEPVSPSIVESLDVAGLPWKAVGSIDHAKRLEPAEGWGGAVVSATSDAAGALAFCRAMRNNDSTLKPLLLMLSSEHLNSVELDDELCDDFCVTTATAAEFQKRLRVLLRNSGGDMQHEVLEYGPLILNLETYQASLDGKPVDLTFMEYELLKFLAKNPGKVFTRETLLTRVWRYEYYGGARTVDVHVRRLRVKLGEEHGNLISTVRSVGYRFGNVRP